MLENGARSFGLRHILKLPALERNRRSDEGAVDAMAEALLISRADVFMRLVVGTSGFSTFAYLSNALRVQHEWAVSEPALVRTTAEEMPNYIVTTECGRGRCFTASPQVRMASVAWHGEQYTRRSCGDVIKRIEAAGTESLGCRGLNEVKPATKKKEKEKEKDKEKGQKASAQPSKGASS